MTSAQPGPPDARRAEILAWALYDWANSAYSTLSITILVAYLQLVVLPGTPGKVVWAWGISCSMLVAALLSPVLGALADANQSKRRWLAGTALPGAAAAMLLACVPPEHPAPIVTLFVVMALLFELSFGFYNGFLPELADEKTMNRVSGWGFALGYLGGGTALGVVMLLMVFGPRLGVPETVTQLRIGIFIMGLWWGVFTLPTVWFLQDRGSRPQQPLPWRRATGAALREVGHTLKNLRRYKVLCLFLLGFLFFNDGIQTVISQASTLAIEALAFKPEDLTLLILVIQFVALPGALGVSWLADRLGQKSTLLICLAIWIGLVVAAYFVQTKTQFWILGILLALVLGGTQSVSRAIMGMMTPAGRTAEFFGFFNFSGKATSFLGTFVFGLILSLGGGARQAVLSLLVFFLIGGILVLFINVAKGRQEALGQGSSTA